jgi:dienelactone hydrolase
VISGLRPREAATIRAVRRIVSVRAEGTPARADTVTYASWATLRANARGSIDVDAATPLAGTWSAPDPQGILWSMIGSDSVSEPSLPPGDVRLTVTARGRPAASTAFTLRRAVVPLVERTVVADGVAGAYAAPADGQRHPVVLLLHGSEGGDTATAKLFAQRFAARGFAALAVVYVSYGGVLPGVPSMFDAVPLELLDRARNWTGTQPEADTSRTGIWGASKGGELAMLAAANRSWPTAVVGCVPSDVVWAGFGREPAPGEALSSWSIGGRALPAIPYDHYEDVFSGKASAREVHDRSRAKSPEAVGPARIPIERTTAHLLLLGSGHDDVWGSGTMTANIEASLKAAGKSPLVQAVRYERASHDICGDGSVPVGLYEDGLFDRHATAAASADAWRRSVAFLQRTLLAKR